MRGPCSSRRALGAALEGSSIAEGDVGGRRPRWMFHEPEGALLSLPVLRKHSDVGTRRMAAFYGEGPKCFVGWVRLHFSKWFGLGLALFRVGVEGRDSGFEVGVSCVKWPCCFCKGVMAHYAKKVGALEDLFAKIRDQLAASSKGEGSSKAPLLAGPMVETVRPAAKRPAVSKLKGAKVQMRTGVEIKLTDPEVAIVEAADPGLLMRAWNEYMPRRLVLGRRLSAMMQEEIAARDNKKLADELAALKVQVERDQQNWDDEKKKLEAEVKKLKVGVLTAEKKLKLKQVEVDELQARRKVESEEVADEISGLQQAVYSEHVKGFEKALRQAEFLYKEVSVTDCRFNVNLDIYENKMLDVAEISKLKALAEGEEAAQDEEGTLVTTPVIVGGDHVSNEDGLEEEAEVEAVGGGDDVAEE
ncbi:hypothetical protein DEO72_LG1g2169 [Vigna unguiculata]|uniref:Uncharacterized protein n=1 Tax=Vigna unguiculata TaxID=3917 RepID=A0A4D6KPU5_VIGUN|nr:hypothetical protein DEO72_LG1g2169 [Vigna unguiculata]